MGPVTRATGAWCGYSNDAKGESKAVSGKQVQLRLATDSAGCGARLPGNGRLVTLTALSAISAAVESGRRERCGKRGLRVHVRRGGAA